MASVTSIFPEPSAAAPSTAAVPRTFFIERPCPAGVAGQQGARCARYRDGECRSDARGYEERLSERVAGPGAGGAAVAGGPQSQIQAPVSAPHRIDPSEVAAALKRASALIASKDIAAARLVLQRVANDGDAQAAVTLAETYDPAILERLNVYGMAPDVAMARHWYEIAQKLGSTEAAQRLGVLASTNR